MTKRKIPKILHRIWLDEPVPERYEKFWDRAKELMPDWEFRTWDDSSALDWMRCREVFDEQPTWAGKSDVVRYEVLARFGGVYIDTDVEPLRAFDELLEDPRAFIAWENNTLLCPTVIGAPPEHPALLELLERLPEHAAQKRGKQPNQITGPEFITPLWLVRDDVRRLPPITFYPVGWWERERLGEPYPKESYAVHHWAQGWGAAGAPTPIDAKIVILVPWRGGDPDREASWAVVREHIQSLGWSIVTGDSPGENWNRSAAINAAAAAAGDWDVAVIIDSDTVDDLEAIRKGVETAIHTGGVVVPWNIRHKLSKGGTDWWVKHRGTIAAQHLDRADRTGNALTIEMRGGTTIVARASWNEIGGFDEEFVEWGGEDCAFRVAARTLTSLHEIKSTCVHLWHPRQRPTGKSRTRYDLYRAADGKPAVMKRLLRGAEPAVSILVPFRDLDGDRTPSWEWIRERWRELLPTAEIVMGSDDGEPFSKTTAVNDAYRNSSGDVLVITDADLWLPDEEVMRDAIRQADLSGRLVVPWKEVHRLSEEDSRAIMAGDVQELEETIARQVSNSPAPHTAGGLFVISRASFERVQGMDPRFRGWGYEDISFRRQCDAILGKTFYMKGDAYCLWHERPERPKLGRIWGEHDRGKMNSMLNLAYMRAERRPSEMRRIAAQHPLDPNEEPGPPINRPAPLVTEPMHHW